MYDFALPLALRFGCYVCVGVLSTVPISNIRTADASDRSTLSAVTGYLPNEGIYYSAGKSLAIPEHRFSKENPTNETDPERSPKATKKCTQ